MSKDFATLPLAGRADEERIGATVNAVRRASNCSIERVI